MEIVPGLGGDPAMFGFVALGADEACRVGHAECADGPGVGEEGVVDGGWDESMAKRLMKG